MPKLKILHLEDLPTDAELVKRSLSKSDLDFELVQVDNQKDFVDKLGSFFPDLILSDHSLPSFNSTDALRILKRRSSNIPFILVTATISEEFAVEAMKQGAADYVLKDRLQRLPNAVKNAYEKWQFETERLKFLEEIISNEALLKTAEKLARVGSWQGDMITGKAKWSEEFYNILGFTSMDVEPSVKNFFLKVHPDDILNVKKSLEYAVTSLDSLKMDFRLMMDDFTIKYISSNLQVERNNEGKAIRLTGFNQDVTEAKKAEESLRQSEHRFREFFQTAPESILVFDADRSLFVDYNDNALNLFKFLPHEIIEKSFADLSPSFQSDGTKSGEKITQMIVRTMAGDKPIFDWTICDAEGKLIECEIRLVMLLNADKNLIRSSIIDITERKTAEQMREKITDDLFHRNKDLEQFAYIVSHNLRAPVANILGISQNFKDIAITDSDKEILMKGMDESVRRLDEVVKDLNHILQVKREINEIKEEVVFSKLLEGILISIKHLLKENDIEINSDFSEVDNLVTIKSYMHSIFYNLISNSIKYRQPAKHCIIEIKSHLYANKIELTFKDNGSGIDMEKSRQFVFGLYKRFHFNVEGKGMGLFMVKTQVEAMGGKIHVESEVNNGTEFKIEFIR